MGCVGDGVNGDGRNGAGRFLRCAGHGTRPGRAGRGGTGRRGVHGRRNEDRNMGVPHVPPAEAGTGLTDLAESAGQLALKRSGVDAADVDLLVLAMSDIAEHLYWDPAAAT